MRFLPIAGLLDLSWTMITFFIFPIIATTNKGLFENMQESYTIMKNNFGLNSGALATFSILHGVVGRIIFTFCFSTAFFGLFIFQPTVINTFYAFIYTLIKTGHGTLEDLTVVKTLIGVGALSMASASALMATARTIFKTAVYQCTQGKPSGPFSAEAVHKIIEK